MLQRRRNHAKSGPQYGDESDLLIGRLNVKLLVREEGDTFMIAMSNQTPNQRSFRISQITVWWTPLEGHKQERQQ